MEQSEIIEGNRLIADFMGWIHHSDPIYDKHEMENLSYHSSWNWLMPAWIKFRNINLDNKEYSEWLTSLSWYLYISDEPIRLFERLVFAIKWYNSQPVKLI